MSDFNPTDEQVQARDHAASGVEQFVLDACAGSGKTTTAREMCKAANGRVIYFVYNSAAAQDARNSFPKNVKVSTTSALAWHHYPEYQDRMRPGAKRVRAKDTASLVGLTQPLQIGVNLALSPITIASWALETITKFCYSADVKISEKHVPVLASGLELLQEDMLRTEVTAWARKIWAAAIKVDSHHRFTFDYGFKLLTMSPPDLGYDTVIIDEAQDSNDATLRLVQAQISSQLIAIGDPAQQLYCQPVQTMVEVPDSEWAPHGNGVRGSGPAMETKKVAIEEIQAGDAVVTYDNSHIYKKGRKVSHVTRFHHTGRLIRVATATGATSAYTDKHHCMVRVGDSLKSKFVVYLMKQGEKYRIGRTRFMYASQSWSFGLAIRSKAEKADSAWVLSVHDTMAEASLAESLVQHQYNIPGIRFEPTHERDEMDVKVFWSKYGENREAAQRCLESHGRLIDYPLWTAGTTTNPIGIRRPFVTAAANVIDGMMVLPLANVTRRRGEDEAPRHLWEEVHVTNELYDGDVVSLEVEGHHTYFGDGILTHNSWRGATDIMSKFHGPRLALSKSFRFGPEVADEAHKWLEHTGTGITCVGNESMSSRVFDRPLPQTDAILCRTNATAMARAIEELDAGKKVAIVGGTEALRTLAFAARDLMNGERTSHPELSAFTDWSELMAFTEEPGGGDLKALVQLVNTYKVSGILAACSRLVPDSPQAAKAQRRTFDAPDVVCSTAHKSKGREWMNVEIADDFKEPEDVEDPLGGKPEPGPISRHDAMLHYVTVTRARGQLNRGGLAWIDRHPKHDKLSKVS